MVDVDFYVCFLAFAIPGVFTTFNTMSHGYSSSGLHLSIDLRQSTERQVREQRELDESNACNTVLKFHTVPFYQKGYLGGGLLDVSISRLVKSST